MIREIERASPEFVPLRRLKGARDFYGGALHHRAAIGASNALVTLGMNWDASEAQVKRVIRLALVPWLLESRPSGITARTPRS